MRIVPLLAYRPPVDGHVTAYICRNYVCEAPTTDPQEVVSMLSGSYRPTDTLPREEG
jgi:uncharacterized protein YyaL (SSP411 family)